jgi:hypothetical protein
VVKYWINMGDILYGANIQKVTEEYAKDTGGDCRFVGCLCLKGKSGYTDRVLTFWQEKPARPEYSNYFGLFRNTNGTMITNAVSIAEGTWDGLADPETGEVLFSRDRHDFRRSKSGKFTVDGGRDYLKISGHGFLQAKLRVVRDRMILEDVYEHERLPQDSA